MAKKQAEPAKKYPKVVLPMTGNRKGVVTLQEYKGKMYAMFREQYQNPEGEFVFGKNGFNVPLSLLTQEKCDKLASFFTKLGEKVGQAEEESEDEDD
jgi:hypothetical protein